MRVRSRTVADSEDGRASLVYSELARYPGLGFRVLSLEFGYQVYQKLLRLVFEELYGLDDLTMSLLISFSFQ